MYAASSLECTSSPSMVATTGVLSFVPQPVIVASIPTQRIPAMSMESNRFMFDSPVLHFSSRRHRKAAASPTWRDSFT